MIRRPPRSTLFPYTSSSDLCLNSTTSSISPCACESWQRVQRSEEHTSELQSPYDLVCRLLLEKKKEIYLDEQNHIRSRASAWGAAGHTAPCCVRVVSSLSLGRVERRKNVDLLIFFF